jgi:hypothetical protein
VFTELAELRDAEGQSQSHFLVDLAWAPSQRWELYEILSNGRSNKDSYVLLENIFDVGAMKQNPYVFNNLLAETAATLPDKSFPLNIQNYFRDAGLRGLRNEKSNVLSRIRHEK